MKPKTIHHSTLTVHSNPPIRHFPLYISPAKQQSRLKRNETQIALRNAYKTSEAVTKHPNSTQVSHNFYLLY